MKVFTDEHKVASKQKLAARASLIGMAFLISAFVMSLPLQVNLQSNLPLFAWPVAIVGLLIASVGTYHINRWVRPPLAHKALIETLKGLDNKHTLFNYFGPVPHLLVSPKGLVPIVVKRFDGVGRYADGRWNATFSVRRLYGQGLTAERLGNPDADLVVADREVQTWLEQTVPEYAKQVPVAPVVVFISPKASIDLGETSSPITTIEGLNKIIRRDILATGNEMPREAYKTILKTLQPAA